MDTTLIFSIAIAAALVLLLWFGRKRSRPPNPNGTGERLDTLIGWPPATTHILRPCERLAYSTLRLALPGYMILAQVPIARFINVSKRNSYAEWMRRIGSQCVDLVICDITSHVVAVVEVRPPDAQLSEPLRRRLDRVARALDAVGIPLHVWNQESLPSVESARESITPKMPAVPVALAALKSAAQAAAARAHARSPFADTDREWSPDDIVEIIEMREPTPSTWFDELDSVPATLPPTDEQRRR